MATFRRRRYCATYKINEAGREDCLCLQQIRLGAAGIAEAIEHAPIGVRVPSQSAARASRAVAYVPLSDASATPSAPVGLISTPFSHTTSNKCCHLDPQVASASHEAQSTEQARDDLHGRGTYCLASSRRVTVRLDFFQGDLEARQLANAWCYDASL